MIRAVCILLVCRGESSDSLRLELCDYRIESDGKKEKVGLPERRKCSWLGAQKFNFSKGALDIARWTAGPAQTLKGMFFDLPVSEWVYVFLPNLYPESLRGYVFLMDLTPKSLRGYVF